MSPDRSGRNTRTVLHPTTYYSLFAAQKSDRYVQYVWAMRREPEENPSSAWRLVESSSSEVEAPPPEPSEGELLLARFALEKKEREESLRREQQEEAQAGRPRDRGAGAGDKERADGPKEKRAAS